MPKKIILIASSTGGIRALRELLEGMPRLNACMLIVQHMPLFINASLQESLNAITDMDVRIATHGMMVETGCIYLAPSDVHMELVVGKQIRLTNAPKVWYVRPAADVLMNSIKSNKSGKFFSVVLTGMGRDGAAGLQHIKQLGGTTFAQDQASSTVFGMPKEAIATGAVDFIMPPKEIQTKLIQLANA